uniref:Uncharacterized protein n=1 Tax=Pithovirus LCPAC102 TaxID=2506587 RepID=A0A4D5XF98_9VIRU|nr:MAG: hypothetical protein LCPAC102_01360 [Pithovirus LCPAC102]
MSINFIDYHTELFKWLDVASISKYIRISNIYYNEFNKEILWKNLISQHYNKHGIFIFSFNIPYIYYKYIYYDLKYSYNNPNLLLSKCITQYIKNPSILIDTIIDINNLKLSENDLDTNIETKIIYNSIYNKLKGLYILMLYNPFIISELKQNFEILSLVLLLPDIYYLDCYINIIDSSYLERVKMLTINILDVYMKKNNNIFIIRNFVKYFNHVYLLNEIFNTYIKRKYKLQYDILLSQIVLQSSFNIINRNNKLIKLASKNNYILTIIEIQKYFKYV